MEVKVGILECLRTDCEINKIKDRVGATSRQDELWKNACRLSGTVRESTDRICARGRKYFCLKRISTVKYKTITLNSWPIQKFISTVKQIKSS